MFNNLFIRPTLLAEQYAYILKAAKPTLLGLLSLMAASLYLLAGLGYSVLESILWSLVMLVLLAYYFRSIYKYLPKIKNGEPLNYSRLTKKLWFILFLMGGSWGYIFFEIIRFAHVSQVSTLHSYYEGLAVILVVTFSGSSLLSIGADFRAYMILNLPAYLGVLAALFLTDQGRNMDNFMIIIIFLPALFIFTSAFRFSQKFAENNKHTQQVQQTQNELISVLGKAEEYRDEETGQHILRMSHACYLLAKKIGQSEDEARLIQDAASLHDIGKIGVPDAILLKPGKLSPEEFELMKRHTTMGGHMLGSSDNPTMKLARIICLTHHEKWDGSGYPKGISGNHIPLAGRIAALCDVFDAIMSDRPYKEAWPLEKALSLIQENSGKHFDPELTKPFLEIVPDIMEYRLKLEAPCLVNSPCMTA